MAKLPAAVQAAIRKNKPQATEDQLAAIRMAVVEATQYSLDINDLEAKTSEKKAELNKLVQDKIPELMDIAGIDHIGVPAVGNLPAVDVRLAPYYSAGISASWDDEKKATALKYLESVGAGDLIKTSVSIDFPREKRSEALEFAKMIEEKLGIDPEVSETVHKSTLTSWLREKAEAHQMPKLSEIGGTVGRVAKIKERKEK